ncbi:MAG: TIGR03118 family protein, partial [Ignavibacteriales bacterium]
MLRKKYLFILAIAGFLFVIISGCSDKAPSVSPVAPDQSGSAQLNKSASANKNNSYQQVNLVSNISGFSASRLDPNLQNAWGLAISPTGRFWISANGTGLSLIYDSLGNQAISPVTIPTVNNASGGTPSGVVYNFTNCFTIPNTNGQSKFIFAGEDGIISVWGPSLGSVAAVAADQSGQSAVYKGIDIAMSNDRPFLYAANFKQARIDVFDSDFNLVSNMPFADNEIPAGFAPFNIKHFNNQIYVTYA